MLCFGEDFQSHCNWHFAVLCSLKYFSLEIGKQEWFLREMGLSVGVWQFIGDPMTQSAALLFYPPAFEKQSSQQYVKMIQFPPPLFLWRTVFTGNTENP